MRVIEASTLRERQAFIGLPFRLYRGDRNWVPPLKRDLASTLTTQGNPFLASGPHKLLLALDGGRPVGRLLAGANAVQNAAKGVRTGYLSLFEAEDERAAFAVFAAAKAYLQDLGIDTLKGPLSPTNGDDYRGLLVHGFDSPPVLFDSYNPPGYGGYFDAYGFVKDIDLYAYRFVDAAPELERARRAVAYARQRYKYRVDSLDLRRLDRDMAEIKRVLDAAMPADWSDLSPPSMDEIRAMAKRLKPLVVPDIIGIARTEDGEPIGFSLALPDYNQVLARMGGSLFPLGWLKFLIYRRRIDAVRVFVLFVTPPYRNKGVPAAIFVHTLDHGRRLGYRWGEGSTIGELNLPSRRAAEGAGGVHYKTYRIYTLKL